MDKEVIGISLKEYIKWGNDFNKRYKLKVNTPKKRINFMFTFLSKFLLAVIPQLLALFITTFIVTLIIIFYKLSPNILYLFMGLMLWYFLGKTVFTKKYISIVEAMLNSF